MDLTTFAAPRSDQINGDDLIAGPITVTIADVRQGNAEQPVNIDLAERPGRAYRPSKSMLRVLIAAWGKESSAFTGRRLTLYRNPDITFGRDKVGGIEISHMSHIDREMAIPLTVTRGKKKLHTVKPLPADAQTTQPMPEFATADDARAYYGKRKAEGASEQELAEIMSVGKALQAQEQEAAK